MFELCDNLIGIYKTYNCTKTITIDPRIYDKREHQTSVNADPSQIQTNGEINGRLLSTNEHTDSENNKNGDSIQD